MESKVGKYYILREIASGQFGTVYMCRLANSAKLFAVKEQKIESLNPEKKYTLDEIKSELDDESISELDISMNIKSEWLPKVYEIFIEKGALYIVSELLGKSVDSVFVRQSQNSKEQPSDETLAEMKRVIKDSLKGLCVLHEKNYVHSDFRPYNILTTGVVILDSLEVLNPQGTKEFTIKEFEDANKKDKHISAKLIDFGLCHDIYSDTYLNNIIRPYKSLEAIFDLEPDQKQDIWALGCTVFEMLTGDDIFPVKAWGGLTKDEDHLISIKEIVGDPLKKIKSNKFNHLKPILNSVLEYPLEDILIETYGWEMDSPQLKLFSNFILRCLTLSVRNRPTAQSLLEDPLFD